jgi:hypothetical protein
MTEEGETSVLEFRPVFVVHSFPKITCRFVTTL